MPNTDFMAPTAYDAEGENIRRKMAFAQALQQQGAQELDGKMVSGHYVAPSITQYLAKGLQTYMGGRGQAEAAQQMADLGKSRQAGYASDMQKMIDALRGTPAEHTLPDGQQGPQKPAVPGSVDNFYQAATQSQFPQLREMGLHGVLTQAQQQQKIQQDEQLRQKYSQVLSQPGMTAQKALAMGVPEAHVKSYFEAPLLGKDKLMNVNGQLVGEKTGTPTGAVIPKQADAPNLASDLLIPDPNNPGKFIVNQQLVGAKSQIAQAGKTSVNQTVNSGQKGFDNTLKLRTDFRSEPVYKAHREMQSAHSQIEAAIKQNSPAGDLAAATKIMKLLDPGSVVRESELGMAMAATGLLDKATSYATNLLNGTKLTEKQRKDFLSLAGELYGVSVNQYNAKRNEYKQIAGRNELNEADVVGEESKAAKPPISPKGRPALNDIFK